MKWNGRYYRPGYGINLYPKKEESITELLKPLSEKQKKGNVWIPVLNQPINVLKEEGTPTPPVSPSPTPTKTSTPTPTPTPSSSSISLSPTPTPTKTGTPTPTPSSPSPATITYRTNLFSSTNSTTYTFTGVNFGTTGLVVIAVGGNAPSNQGDLTTVTIDGVNANTAITGSFTSAIWKQGIFYAEVTNTSGDIVITAPGTGLRNCSVGVWVITNYTSSTPTYTNSTSSLNSTESITTSTLSSGSVGISAVIDASSPANNLVWTNATERYERQSGEVGEQADNSGADFTQSTSGTRTVSVTNLSTSGSLLQLVVWR